MELMQASLNPQVKFMYGLPALHDSETPLGKDVAEACGLKNGLGVTNDVFESEYNIAFEQAENRIHAIKAILESPRWEPDHVDESRGRAARPTMSERDASRVPLIGPLSILALITCAGAADAQQQAADSAADTKIRVTLYPILIKAPIFGASVDLPSLPSAPGGGGSGGGGESGALSGSTDTALSAGVHGRRAD